MDCFYCTYRRFLPATLIDPSEESCDIHEPCDEDGTEFNSDHCTDYYDEADARDDAKNKDNDRY